MKVQRPIEGEGEPSKIVLALESLALMSLIGVKWMAVVGWVSLSLAVFLIGGGYLIEKFLSGIEERELK